MTFSLGPVQSEPITNGVSDFAVDIQNFPTVFPEFPTHSLTCASSAASMNTISFCWPILAVSRRSLTPNCQVLEEEIRIELKTYMEVARTELHLSSPTRYTQEWTFPGISSGLATLWAASLALRRFLTLFIVLLF